MRLNVSLLTVVCALINGIHAFSGKTCRIMPLGASITNGSGSSRGNGYRGTLYDLLANDGNTVNLVGRQKSGDFHHPHNEGYPGALISEANQKGQEAMPLMRPNVATVLVGTNDMLRQVDLAGAPDRLYKLIEDVINWEWLTLVAVATLPPSPDAGVNDRINSYNSAIRDVVQRFNDQGRWVVLAEVNAALTTGDLGPDGIHPNDGGYERMAKAFYEAIKVGESKGWIADVFGPAPKMD
ncbi:lipolytic enzyme [Auriculariales sp. MPI-PUGE-AT-0066]|nr:lipolytic enzyme [Auriculariales sp. MPI-PUGE-AT-0066]